MSTQQLSERPLAVASRGAEETKRNLVLENEHVRVIETSYPVGGGVPMHDHPYPHVSFVIEGGTVETSGRDGGAQRIELHEGEGHWRAPQSHSTRNVGVTPVRIVEVEVKGGPGMLAGNREARITTPADLVWTKDSLDPRRATADILGNPSRPGPYAVRFRVDETYRLGLHRHPGEDEHLTVLTGALGWSTGAEGSGAPEGVAPAGSYVVFPAGTAHRLWATEATTVQMTGIGPRTYEYADPADDPRSRG